MLAYSRTNVFAIFTKCDESIGRLKESSNLSFSGSNPDRVDMMDFIIAFFARILDLLIMPLRFHFGHHWLFIEIMVLLSNSVDVIGFFFVTFLVIKFVCLYRNVTFQALLREIYDSASSRINDSALLQYLAPYFETFRTSLIARLQEIKDRLKRK